MKNPNRSSEITLSIQLLVGTGSCVIDSLVFKKKKRIFGFLENGLVV